MMINLATAAIVVDTTGAIKYLPGDTSISKQQAPRVPDLSPVTLVALPGSSYAVEFDSTGEAYIEFLDANQQPVSNPILMARGMSILLNATYLRVFGVRRAGLLRITAGQNDARELVTNMPSGYTEYQNFFYPVGTNATTGPAGWTTIPNPYTAQTPTASYLAYNPNKTLDMSAVLNGSARRMFVSNTPTGANFNLQHHGFVDIDSAGNIIRFWPYSDAVVQQSNVGGERSVDAQTYWRPAISWWPTAAGIAAGAYTSSCNLWTTADYVFKRTPGQPRFDFT